MVARPALTSIPLGQAVDRFVHAMDRSAQVRRSKPTRATVETYRRNLADLVLLVGEDVLTDDVTGADLEDAVYRYSTLADRRLSEHRDDPLAQVKSTRGATGRERGKSEWSKATFWRAISRFFTYAEKQGWVQVSPTQYVEHPPSVSERTPKAPEREALFAAEAQALLRHGPGEEPSMDVRTVAGQRARYLWARNRAVLTLLTVAGPRVSEVCNADRADFSGAGSGQVWWRIVGKGDHVREVPLSDDVMGLVMDAWELAPEAKAGAERAAFVSVRGTRLAPRDVQNFMQVATARVKASPDRLLARAVTPHGLRHTAATLLAGAGWDIRLIAKMLGHANLSNLSSYLDTRSMELIPMMVDHPVSVRTPGARTAAASAGVDELRVLPNPDRPSTVATTTS